MSTTTTRIWDLPTRLFHWLLAVCVIALLATAKIGGNAMEWHLRLGHVVLALLAFRLAWGLVGGHWSRFATFIPGPARLARYLRGAGSPADHMGHSPLGALSVIALLLVLMVQVGTGLVSDDEIAFAGPLSRRVSADTVAWATQWHQGWGQWLLLALLGLHLGAIAFYAVVRRRHLVPPMVHGNKPLPPGSTASRDSLATRLTALVLAALCAAAAWWVYSLGSAAPAF